MTGLFLTRLRAALLSAAPGLFAAFSVFGQTQVPTNSPPDFEPLGQCSRRTSLVLSEIMYHPTNSNLEFIELFNSRGEPQDLSGYQLGGSISYTFPAGSQ